MANEFIARNGFLAQNNSQITGSLSVAGGITGSFSGTASYTTQALSSSYAVSSSYAISSSYALSASYTLSSSYAVSSSYATSSTSASYATQALTASYALSSGGTPTSVTGANAILNQSSAATTWSFVHNLNNQYPVFQVFDSNNNVVIPQSIIATNTTTATIYFPTAIAGTAVASIGGYTGSATTATSASYAATASYATSLIVSGNVGIGTSSPSYPLDVQSNASALGISLRGRASDNISLFTFFNNAANTQYAKFTAASTYFSTEVGGSERMRITGSNVGIGTSSPSYPLDVQYGGNISQRLRNTAAGGTATLLLETANTFSGTSQAYVQCIGSAGSGTSQLVFATAGASGDTTATERMRIISAGFLKAKGAATNYASLANSSHEISTDTESNYTLFCSSQAATTPYGLYLWYPNASPNNSGNEFLACADSTNSKAYIFSNGNLANRNGTYGTISSDIRLKENIVPATSKLEDLLKLNVVNFNLIDDTDKKKQLGFIAQEFQEVFPSLVSIRDTRKYDEEGNLLSGLEDALGVNVGMEFAILVKAIQEQQAQIESQNTLIQELTTRLTALENK